MKYDRSRRGCQDVIRSSGNQGWRLQLRLESGTAYLHSYKRIISSELDKIEGIGQVKKQRLYQTFGSIKAIKQASKEELKKVKGLTNKDIDLLISIFKADQ